jgi:magnesium-transporting ATPase (P-type)
VNDAPALKAADIGIAMGKSGTEVAKSASDMVLTDDNFATIVEAVSEGRNVYSNIKKTVYFLLVCNMSEVIIMLFAQMAGWGILLTPVMLLLINLFGDGIPGISLARDPATSDLMNNKPIKRNASLFSDGLFRMIFQQTIFCSLAVLIGYYLGAFVIVSDAFGPSTGIGRAMAFLITGITSVIHVFSTRSSKSIFKTAILNNKPLLLSAMAMFLFFVSLVALPFGQVFNLPPISAIHWLIVMGLCLLPTALREIVILIDKLSLFIQRRQLIHETSP